MLSKFCDQFYALEPIPTSSVYYKHADEAYNYLIGVFGCPIDHSSKYDLSYSFSPRIVKFNLKSIYFIYLYPEGTDPVKQIASIAHEMYHRVTNSRRTFKYGLHRMVWVDESLAAISTIHCLNEMGYTEYVAKHIENCYKSINILDIISLKKIKRSSLFMSILLQKPSHYPVGFGATTTLLGLAMQELVGWESMCRLVDCKTWEDWFQDLQPDKLKYIRNLIDE